MPSQLATESRGIVNVFSYIILQATDFHTYLEVAGVLFLWVFIAYHSQLEKFTINILKTSKIKYYFFFLGNSSLTPRSILFRLNDL